MNNNFKEDYKYNDPEIKELMSELHYTTGEVIHSIQKLEYRIKYLIALQDTIEKIKDKNEKETRKIKTYEQATKYMDYILSTNDNITLGENCKRLDRLNIFNESIESSLDNFSSLRNQLVHRFYVEIDFKTNDKNDEVRLDLNRKLKTLRTMFQESRILYKKVKEKIIAKDLELKSLFKN